MEGIDELDVLYIEDSEGSVEGEVEIVVEIRDTLCAHESVADLAAEALVGSILAGHAHTAARETSRNHLNTRLVK